MTERSFNSISVDHAVEAVRCITMSLDVSTWSPNASRPHFLSHTVGNFAKIFQKKGNFEILTTNFFLIRCLDSGLIHHYPDWIYFNFLFFFIYLAIKVAVSNQFFDVTKFMWKIKSIKNLYYLKVLAFKYMEYAWDVIFHIKWHSNNIFCTFLLIFWS